jgi:hypothetical protein
MDNILFVCGRDGEIAAKAYAKQMVVSYRKAVLQVRGRVARRLMIQAYLTAKRYLKESN